MHTLSLFQSARLVSRKQFLIGSLALMALPQLILPQSSGTKPITKNGLTQALTIGGLSQQELQNQVTRRGVDFSLTPETESDLRHAGASGDLIKAVRENYRGAANSETALAALDAPDTNSSTRTTQSASSRPSHSNADSPGETKHPLTLHDVRKVYIAKMPNGLDGYLGAAISNKLGNIFTIVLDRPEADAILQSSGGQSAGTVSMVDPSGKIVLWSGSADDGEKIYLNFRHGGQRQVAEKLASKLKKALS